MTPELFPNITRSFDFSILVFTEKSTECILRMLATWCFLPTLHKGEFQELTDENR